MYGKFESFSLSSVNHNMLYIPKGCAHGFIALSGNATVFYNTSTVHSKEHDSGIRYDSFGFDWPLTAVASSEHRMVLMNNERIFYNMIGYVEIRLID